MRRSMTCLLWNIAMPCPAVDSAVSLHHVPNTSNKLRLRPGSHRMMSKLRNTGVAATWGKAVQSALV